MCLVTVYIDMLVAISTTIIKGVRGSWELKDTRSSVLKGSRVRQSYTYAYMHVRKPYST